MSSFILYSGDKFTVCYDINEMIKYTSIYRSNLNFDKTLVAKGEDIDVYNDFIHVNFHDTAILERISNDSSNFMRKEMGLDTNSSEYTYYNDLSELRELLDSNSNVKTILFEAQFNGYIVLVEVYNSSPILNKLSLLEETDMQGFDISKFHAHNRYHLFKCDNKGGFDYRGSYLERYARCW